MKDLWLGFLLFLSNEKIMLYHLWNTKDGYDQHLMKLAQANHKMLSHLMEKETL